MPRRKATDGAPPAPKAPRSRKKKVNPEENKPPDAYDQMMQPNGYMDGMEGGMYAPHPDYGYGHTSYGQPPPHFGSPEPNSNSPYLMPQQSNTPQSQMIMRSMPPPQPTQLGPAPSALEFRIHEMNRRLYIFSSTAVSESDHQQWWDAFSHEFFDDDCKLWFVFGDDQTPLQEREKYCVGRNTIPRFFRSIFDSGIRELVYVLRGPTRECQTSGGCTAYENEHVLQVTKYDVPTHTEVNTECKLYIEFTPYDEVMNYRIRAWTLEMKQSDEFTYNDIKKDYERLDCANQERVKLTKMGFFKQTLGVMSLAKILEPMQMIMSTAKSNGWNADPRDIMKRTLFFHYTEAQRKEMQMRQMNPAPIIMPVPEQEKPKPARKRQRKPAANSKANKKTAAAAASAAANASPAPSNPAFQPNPMAQSFTAMGYQDVMVVGEPSMMGGDFGDEDERTISRVENSQYDPNALQMQQMSQGGPAPQMGGVNGPPNMNMGPSTMGPPQTHGGGMPNGPPQQMGQPMSHSQMNNQMQNPMVNSMHMPGPMANNIGGGMGNNSMPNSMASSMPSSMPNQMAGHMSNPMNGPISNQMPGPMSNQMGNPISNPMSNSMGGNGIPPMSMPSGMPSQMQMSNPMPNSMPPGYSFQQQQQWPQPTNAPLITG